MGDNGKTEQAVAIIDWLALGAAIVEAAESGRTLCEGHQRRTSEFKSNSPEELQALLALHRELAQVLELKLAVLRRAGDLPAQRRVEREGELE